MKTISDLNQGRKNNFDFLRLIAAVAVIFSHSFPLSLKNENSSEPLYALSNGQLTTGNLSVYIFFIISGFLITQSYDTNKDINKFALSRILRIFPALFIVVLLTVFLLGPIVASTNQYFSQRETYDYLTTFLLFDMPDRLPGVFVDNAFEGAINGSLWSLWYELVFYIVVGALGFLKSLNKKVVCLLFFATFLLLSIKFPHGELYLLTFSYFSAGMLLYLSRKWIPVNRYLALFSFLILVSGIFLGGFKELFVIFGSYLILYLALSPKIKLPQLSKYGDYSYGLYIFAFPIQQTITHYFGGSMNPVLNFSIALPITLGFAILSWHLVEKKALRLKWNQIKLLSLLRPANSYRQM